jgi:hypothetical protein
MSAALQHSTRLAVAAVQQALALPFELLRSGHAQAVRGGWAPRSLLQQRELDRGLQALERLALGPWARRV